MEYVEGGNLRKYLAEQGGMAGTMLGTTSTGGRKNEQAAAQERRGGAIISRGLPGAEQQSRGRECQSSGWSDAQDFANIITFTGTGGIFIRGGRAAQPRGTQRQRDTGSVVTEHNVGGGRTTGGTRADNDIASARGDGDPSTNDRSASTAVVLARRRHASAPSSGATTTTCRNDAGPGCRRKSGGSVATY
eukprot:g7497.t1